MHSSNAARDQWAQRASDGVPKMQNPDTPKKSSIGKSLVNRRSRSLSDRRDERPKREYSRSYRDSFPPLVLPQVSSPAKNRSPDLLKFSDEEENHEDKLTKSFVKAFSSPVVQTAISSNIEKSLSSAMAPLCTKIDSLLDMVIIFYII